MSANNNPEDFDARADAFLASLPVFTDELNRRSSRRRARWWVVALWACWGAVAGLYCLASWVEFFVAMRNPDHWVHFAWLILGGASFLLIAGALYTIYDSLRGRR